MSTDDMDKAIRKAWPDLAVPNARLPKVFDNSTHATSDDFSPESEYIPPDAEALKGFIADQFKPFVHIPKPDTSDAPPGTFGPGWKAATGLTRSAIGAVESVATPATAEIAAASAIPYVGKPLAIAAGAGFGGHMVVTGVQDFIKAYKAGDVQGAAEAFGNTVVGAFIGGQSAKHGAKAVKDARIDVLEPSKDARLTQQAADEALAATLPIGGELVKPVPEVVVPPLKQAIAGEVPVQTKVLAPAAAKAFEETTKTETEPAEAAPTTGLTLAEFLSRQSEQKPATAEPVKAPETETVGAPVEAAPAQVSATTPDTSPLKVANPDQRITLKARDAAGNELEIKMKAGEAERRLVRRKTLFEMLLDCLGK